MKRFEEVYDIGKLPAGSVEKYKTVWKYLNDMEELTGRSEFNNALELEGEDWDHYSELRSSLIQAIADVVRSQDKVFDFGTVSGHFGNDDFWEEVRKDVSDQTENFLSMQPLRKNGFEERKEKYEDIFKILYVEYENANYAGEKLGLDKKIAALYVRILRFSEDFVINHYLSRRLFTLRLDSYCGLKKEDADFLWELYSEKRGEIEKIALNNRLNDLNYRLYKLTTQLEDIQTNLDFMEYMMNTANTAQTE